MSGEKWLWEKLITSEWREVIVESFNMKLNMLLVQHKLKNFDMLLTLLSRTKEYVCNVPVLPETHFP